MARINKLGPRMPGLDPLQKKEQPGAPVPTQMQTPTPIATQPAYGPVLPQPAPVTAMPQPQAIPNNTPPDMPGDVQYNALANKLKQRKVGI